MRPATLRPAKGVVTKCGLPLYTCAGKWYRNMDVSSYKGNNMSVRKKHNLPVLSSVVVQCSNIHLIRSKVHDYRQKQIKENDKVKTNIKYSKIIITRNTYCCVLIPRLKDMADLCPKAPNRLEPRMTLSMVDRVVS